MAVFENFPYTNVHELNLDWVIKNVKEYIIKYENLEEFVNTSIEEQNKIISEAVKELEDGLQDLKDYVTENLQVIAQTIINELIESGELYVGLNYLPQTEELNIVLSQGVNNG